MVVIEPGNFTKGSPLSDKGSRDDERPQHQVDINYHFAIGRYEVTRREFERFVQSTGHDSTGGCYGATDDGIQLGIDLNWYDPGYPITDNHPVVCVSWNEAVSYAQWLSKETGETYRLLTESEWEYSARAGTKTVRFWGNSDEGCDYANGADLDITPESFLEEMKGRGTKIVLPEDWVVAECHDGYEYSAPVGSFEANDFGVYDILGKQVKNATLFSVGKIEKETEYYLLLNNKNIYKLISDEIISISRDWVQNELKTNSNLKMNFDAFKGKTLLRSKRLINKIRILLSNH